MQMTKNRFVLIAQSGPTVPSHQPTDGSSGEEVACAEGESPVKSRTALSRFSFNSPRFRTSDHRIRQQPSLHLESALDRVVTASRGRVGVAPGMEKRSIVRNS